MARCCPVPGMAPLLRGDRLNVSEIASKGQLRLAFLRWAVVTVPFVLLLGFTAGRSVPTGSENRWYQALAKPEVTPPDWVFPVAWTTLYVLMGLALAMVINARGSRRAAALAMFAVQLALNLAWTPIFFGAHLVATATYVIAAMWVAAVVTTLLFGRIRALAAWLMVPYLVWISFAGVLTWRIDQLNPHAEALAPAPASSQIIE